MNPFNDALIFLKNIPPHTMQALNRGSTDAATRRVLDEEQDEEIRGMLSPAHPTEKNIFGNHRRVPELSLHPAENPADNPMSSEHPLHNVDPRYGSIDERPFLDGPGGSHEATTMPDPSFSRGSANPEDHSIGGEEEGNRPGLRELISEIARAKQHPAGPSAEQSLEQHMHNRQQTPEQVKEVMRF